MNTILKLKPWEAAAVEVTGAADPAWAMRAAATKKWNFEGIKTGKIITENLTTEKGRWKMLNVTKDLMNAIKRKNFKIAWIILNLMGYWKSLKYILDYFEMKQNNEK